MIWFLGFPMFFLLSVKSFFFYNFYYFMDSYTCMLISVTFFILNLVFFFCFFFVCEYEYMMYFICFGFMLFFMNLCFISFNMFNFLFCFEMSMFFMWYSIFNFSSGKDKIFSLVFMFLMNVFGSLPFMIFISEIFSYTMSFYLCFLSVGYWFFSLDSIFFFLFMTLIFLFKLPVFFFHFWLPKAHVSASVSCSMVLASLMLKLASFGLLKFSWFFSFMMFYICKFFVLISSFISFLLVFYILRYFDQKYMVAVSSILHMSLMPLFFFSMSSVGFCSSVFMIVSHGLISFFLFFLVSLFYEQTFNRSIDFNKSSESVSKILCAFIFVYCFMNMGIPPFVNFFSELLSVLFLFNYSFFCLFFLILSMLVVNIFTMFFCTKILFGKKIVFSFNDMNLSFVVFSIFNLFLIFLLPFF